jgi:hypothetical protein
VEQGQVEQGQVEQGQRGLGRGAMRTIEKIGVVSSTLHLLLHTVDRNWESVVFGNGFLVEILNGA